jgi:predicted acylesterase/phospholipase RssA
MVAVFGAMFAAGLAPEVALDRVTGPATRGIVKRDLMQLARGLWARQLLRMEALREGFSQLVPETRFDQLHHPLTVTATDLDSGDLVRFGAGGLEVPLIDALCASCALPLFYAPVVIGGRRYADGGLRAVLPLELALEPRPAMVVAVDVGPGFDERGGEEAINARPMPPTVQIHDEASTILMAGQTQLALALWRASSSRPPLVYVRPKVERGTTFRSDLVQKHVEEGYRATREALAGLQTNAG